MEKRHRVVDLFAGVGGLSYGFAHDRAFGIVMANELDAEIAAAYSLNHPSVAMVAGDVRGLSEERIREACGGSPEMDVVVGGPPCQSYSTLGKRRMDARARLFEEYLRMLGIFRPRLFLFENVEGLLSMQGGSLIKLIEERFGEAGYTVKHRLLDAAWYGVPQHRRRVILVGARGDANPFEYPEPTHGDGDGLLPYVTVGDAFSDLPALKGGETGTDYASPPMNPYQEWLRKAGVPLSDDAAPKNGAHLVRLMEALPDGGTKDDLPPELRPAKGFGNTYAKMWWGRPAPTVTRNFATPSSSRCVHPRDSRAMTTREGARLQSFPDDYRFHGSRQKMNLEIGNAVPPLLSVALTARVKAALEAMGE